MGIRGAVGPGGILALTLTSLFALPVGSQDPPPDLAGAAKPSLEDPDAFTAGEQFAASCDNVATVGMCVEYTVEEMAMLGEGFYRDICDIHPGVWSAKRCPRVNLIGVCDFDLGGAQFFYATADAQYDAKGAEELCTSQYNKWLSAPGTPVDGSGAGASRQQGDAAHGS